MQVQVDTRGDETGLKEEGANGIFGIGWMDRRCCGLKRTFKAGGKDVGEARVS